MLVHPNQTDNQINWDYSEDNLSKLFNDSQVTWDFETTAFPTPTPNKKFRKYRNERLNQLLDNGSSFSPPNSWMMNAANVRKSDTSDNQAVDFDRDSSSEEETLCPLKDFEASESSGD